MPSLPASPALPEPPRDRSSGVERLAFSTNVVAAKFGLHPVTIRRMVARGTLQSILVGRRRLIPASAVERLLNPAPAGESEAARA
jgi:excisionase family DNA binding protein